MVEMKATGLFIGLKMDVYVKLDDKDVLTVTFNDREDSFLRKQLVKLLKSRHLIAGTYQPEKAFSGINLYFTLKDRFFDKTADVEIVSGGIEEMPNEGMVY